MILGERTFNCSFFTSREWCSCNHSSEHFENLHKHVLFVSRSLCSVNFDEDIIITNSMGKIQKQFFPHFIWTIFRYSSGLMSARTINNHGEQWKPSGKESSISNVLNVFLSLEFYGLLIVSRYSINTVIHDNCRVIALGFRQEIWHVWATNRSVTNRLEKRSLLRNFFFLHQLWLFVHDEWMNEWIVPYTNHSFFYLDKVCQAFSSSPPPSHFFSFSFLFRWSSVRRRKRIWNTRIVIFPFFSDLWNR